MVSTTSGISPVDAVVARTRVNAHRRSHQASPLEVSASLTVAAQARAEFLATAVLPSPPIRGKESFWVFQSTPSPPEGEDSTAARRTYFTDYAVLAADAWFDQRANYDFYAVQPKLTAEVAAFTRLVWKATRRVGFGAARASSASGATSGRLVVVAVFDPAGNGLLDSPATNVLPVGAPGADRLFTDYYSKDASDARFLAVSEAGSLLSNAAIGAVQATESNVEALRLEVQTLYQRKDTVFDAILELDAQRGVVNADDLAAAREEIQAAITDSNAAISQELQIEVTRLDDELDAARLRLDGAEGRLTVIESDVTGSFYDKAASDARFAPLAEFQEVRDDLYGAYLDAALVESNYSTIARVTALSNAFHLRSNDLDDAVQQLRVDTYTRAEADAAFAPSADVYTRLQADAAFATASDFQAIDAALSNDYSTRAQADALYTSIASFDALSNAVFGGDDDSGNFYERSEADAKFALATGLQGLEATLTDGYYDKAASDARYAPQSVVAALSNDFFDRQQLLEGGALDATYLPRATAEDRLDALDASASNAEDEISTVIARVEQLSNAVLTQYHDAEYVDATFATQQGLSNLDAALQTGYYDKAASDARFYGSTEGQSTRQDLDSLEALLADSYAPTASNDAAYYSSADGASVRQDLDVIESRLDADYITEVTSDNRYATILGLEQFGDMLYGVSNALETDYYDKAASDARYITNVEMSSFPVSRDEDAGGALLMYAGADPDTEVARFSSNGWMGIGTMTPEFPLHVVGDVYASGGFVNTSDRNYKRDIRRIDDAATKLAEIGGYTFFFTDGPDLEQRHAGVLAQEVMRVLPAAVTMRLSGPDGGMRYGVAYAELTALLVAAVNELSRRDDSKACGVIALRDAEESLRLDDVGLRRRLTFGADQLGERAASLLLTRPSSLAATLTLALPLPSSSDLPIAVLRELSVSGMVVDVQLLGGGDEHEWEECRLHYSLQTGR